MTTRVRQIESNHFDRNTEYLIKAKTGSSLGGDIDFLLRYVPNHPRALASLSRLALRENNPKPSGVSIPVECHFLRGLAFAPDDPAVLSIYGAFLARIDRPKDALARMQEAEKLDPDNATLLYNIGLVLVTLRDYPRARDYAEKAYAKGVTLPGLRERLQKLGYWKNEMRVHASDHPTQGVLRRSWKPERIGTSHHIGHEENGTPLGDEDVPVHQTAERPPALLCLLWDLPAQWVANSPEIHRVELGDVVHVRLRIASRITPDHTLGVCGIPQKVTVGIEPHRLRSSVEAD